ncbi:Mex67p [Lachancea thermotolerans CBS 6340]|uniref:mRNA export factor MEX67 n=1 Tax=Lachancea thermotolerans (strain ATCC 56472 / CBS 6340 / NRRL Y-8284) TaxID=559295 RepID=C5DF30_LACTC|nr:KLTH0D11792p [Lachancea thermotolerans CBS 6340]CAR22785.1 KLTH0D11792p [Lachancea thermotolerans CBS 6340]
MNNLFQNSNNVGVAAQQAVLQNRVKVGVKGWQNATKQDLVSFVSRKTRIGIQDSYVEGNLVIGFVNSRNEASSLLNWNGVRFAGNALKFEILGDNVGLGGAPGTNNTIALLKAFLYKRYNPQAKMLDLGNLRNDPDLTANGLFSTTSTQSKMFPAMMKLASKEDQMVVESVNLSNNNLKDLNMISSLAQTYPNLKNLCLANNQISRFRALEVWKNKFKDLRELLMMNNPITTEPLYRSEIMRLFPKLIILDSVLLRDENKLQQIYSLPMKLQQFFFETNELGQSSIDFVSNFLNLWDTNRTQLMALYTPQSQFSVCIDSSVPSSSVPNSDQNPTFSYYLPLSRNLTKISSDKTKQQRLALGQEAIDKLFRSLPKTKHALQEQPLNYSLEAFSYPQVNGFIITLHGFFDESGAPEIDANKSTPNTSGNRNRRFNHGHGSSTNKLTKKSFDRTWVIVPNPGGVVVASDMLTIRPYADGSWLQAQAQPQAVSQPPIQSQQHPQSQPQVPLPNNPQSQLPNVIQPQIPGVAQTPVPNMPLQGSVGVPLLLPPEVQSKLSPVQLELLNRLHQQTRLNAEYTYMLADQSGWNFDVALKGFQDSVNNIPREAFI